MMKSFVVVAYQEFVVEDEPPGECGVVEVGCCFRCK
jgi:hypothetical protein